jgi:cytochrome b pre-mRNA-processing protein 3
VSLLSRIFAKRDDGRDALRPLWHRTVEIAREPRWYAQYGIADTVAGRFDAITLVLSLVLLRMERVEVLIAPSVRLTELFVDDMDGQLREAGIGDLVVGKKVGRLMSVLGGRLGAIREALPQSREALAEVVTRNVSLTDNGSAEEVAAAMIALAGKLEGESDARVLAGEVTR